MQGPRGSLVFALRSKPMPKKEGSSGFVVGRIWVLGTDDAERPNGPPPKDAGS